MGRRRHLLDRIMQEDSFKDTVDFSLDVGVQIADLPSENGGFMQDICEGDAGRCAAQIIVILFLVFLPCAILSCICLWKKKKREEGKDIFATMRTWKMPTTSFRSIRSTQSTAVLPITSGNKQIKRKKVSTGKLRKAASFQGVNPRMKPMVGELPEHYELRVQLFKKRTELWEIKQRKKDLLNDQNKINSLIEELETEQTRLSFRESTLKKLEMTTPDSRTRFSFQDFVDKFYFQNVSDDFVNTNSIGIMVKADAEANGYNLDTALSSRSSKDVCAICFNGFCVGDGICTPINETCEHVFHPECAEEWLQGSTCCPLCQCNLLGEERRRRSNKVEMAGQIKNYFEAHEDDDLHSKRTKTKRDKDTSDVSALSKTSSASKRTSASKRKKKSKKKSASNRKKQAGYEDSVSPSSDTKLSASSGTRRVKQRPSVKEDLRYGMPGDVGSIPRYVRRQDEMSPSSITTSRISLESRMNLKSRPRPPIAPDISRMSPEARAKMRSRSIDAVPKHVTQSAPTARSKASPKWREELRDRNRLTAPPLHNSYAYGGEKEVPGSEKQGFKKKKGNPSEDTIATYIMSC